MQSEFANVVFCVITVLDELHRDRVITRSVARVGYELESAVEHDDVVAQKRLAFIKQVQLGFLRRNEVWGRIYSLFF